MRRQAGFTLLEVLISSAILGMLIVTCLAFLGDTTELNGVEMANTDLERRTQEALDKIVIEMKEANPNLVSIYDFEEPDDEGNMRWQTALCFPTARDWRGSGDFTYMIGTAVQAEPVWQGVVVYLVCPPQDPRPAQLVKYVDYDSGRNYTTQMPSIINITTTTITLSDGTEFTRQQNHGTSGNQLIDRTASDVVQLVRNPEPPDDPLYPLTLHLQSEKRVMAIGDQKVIIESATSVLARNAN